MLIAETELKMATELLPSRGLMCGQCGYLTSTYPWVSSSLKKIKTYQRNACCLGRPWRLAQAKANKSKKSYIAGVVSGPHMWG